MNLPEVPVQHKFLFDIDSGAMYGVCSEVFAVKYFPDRIFLLAEEFLFSPVSVEHDKHVLSASKSVELTFTVGSVTFVHSVFILSGFQRPPLLGQDFLALAGLTISFDSGRPPVLVGTDSTAIPLQECLYNACMVPVKDLESFEICLGSKPTELDQTPFKTVSPVVYPQQALSVFSGNCDYPAALPDRDISDFDYPEYNSQFPRMVLVLLPQCSSGLDSNILCWTRW